MLQYDQRRRAPSILAASNPTSNFDDIRYVFHWPPTVMCLRSSCCVYVTPGVRDLFPPNPDWDPILPLHRGLAPMGRGTTHPMEDGMEDGTECNSLFVRHHLHGLLDSLSLPRARAARWDPAFDRVPSPSVHPLDMLCYSPQPLALWSDCSSGSTIHLLLTPFHCGHLQWSFLAESVVFFFTSHWWVWSIDKYR